MKFYLGATVESWLRELDVPLFVSARSFTRRTKDTYPKALEGWCLDSGGFTELKMYGEWTVSVEDYVKTIRLLQKKVGKVIWAAPQDWMCEDVMLKKTGLTVKEHQRRTVQNYIAIKEIDDTLPVIPVIQGFSLEDYLQIIEDYAYYGIDLKLEDTVGLGSVCRRQSEDEIAEIVEACYSAGLHNLHGFGVKIRGILKYGQYLQSSDSMAWSLQARYEPPIEGHTHKSCSSCKTYALRWRDKVLNTIAEIEG